MRPTYETAKNRTEQENIALLMSKEWNVVCGATPTLATVDYVLSDKETGDIKALVEFKARNNRKDAYSTFFISEKKLQNSLHLSELLHVPFLLVIKWKDRTGWIKLTTLDGLRVETGGRKDRGDNEDIERMVHIDTRQFKIFP